MDGDSLQLQDEDGYDNNKESTTKREVECVLKKKKQYHSAKTHLPNSFEVYPAGYPSYPP